MLLLFNKCSRARDGEHWECEKCGRKFNLLEANDFRCPECREQVSLNEVADQIREKARVLSNHPSLRGIIEDWGVN